MNRTTERGVEINVTITATTGEKEFAAHVEATNTSDEETVSPFSSEFHTTAGFEAAMPDASKCTFTGRFLDSGESVSGDVVFTLDRPLNEARDISVWWNERGTDDVAVWHHYW